MKLYEEQSQNAKWNAQYNLEGRTHYVDDSTLRFHKARILDTYIADGGLIFALIESYDAGDSRLFRPVIFNVFGNVIERPNLEEGFKTKKQATSAMWDSLNSINAIEVTEQGIHRYESQVAREVEYLREDMAKLVKENKAA